MISFFRWILLPFSLIYQFIVWLRNKMYDYNILSSQKFDIPTVVIGNLAIGGAGKSPMTEYLIRILKDKYKIATLSRGYGRKTKGFKYVNLDSTALEVGDEPLQFKNKFPEITVAVCENRCNGVSILQKNNEVILLDDAYQHRQLKAGFYILLFDFKSLFQTKLTLPTGDFRDVFSSSKRADIIIITKCPDIISEKQKIRIEKTIRAYSNAPVLYSQINYSKPIPLNNNSVDIDLITNMDIFLFCGIANPSPLLDYLKKFNNRIQFLQFSDHHNYSTSDFDKIISNFDLISSENKIILTTEKDIQRISKDYFDTYPIYYIPITNTFVSPENNDILIQNLISYIKKNQSDN